MKALIFVCLLFVGCYHEKETEVPQTYYFNGGTLTTTDSGIVFAFYDSVFFGVHQTLLLKVNEEAPIVRHPGNPDVIFLFKAEFLESLPNTN